MSSQISRSSSKFMALAALVAAACTGSDVSGTGDATTFDAPRARTEMQAMDGLLGATAWASFSAMGPHFSVSPIASAAVASARELAPTSELSALDARRMATASAERLWAAAGTQDGAGVPAIPPQALGTTFVWDVTQRQYVPAAGRVGAPANGIRFVLYAVNPLTKEPVVSAEIGHADLLDIGVSQASGVSLRLLVVSGAKTFLDYTVAAVGTESSGTVSVDGFVTDGTTRVNFEIDARGSVGLDGRKAEVDFEFDVADRGFGATGRVRSLDGTGGQSSHQVDLSVRVKDATIRFDVVGDANTVNASVLVNERVFATITGDPRQPVVRGAGGRELRPDEAQALGQMIGLADTAFRILGDLLKPAERIFGQN